MNRDSAEGKWKQFSGKVRERWGKLTDDDIDVIHGKKDQLAGLIQERYGYAKEEAERQVQEFNRALREEEEAAEMSSTRTRRGL